MKYMGSKNRHSKELLPIILAGRKPEQYYVEPFCGGCNMIDKVENPRSASDTHPQLISLFRAVRDGWIPPSIVSEDEYQLARNANANDCLTGFIGFGCSYSGKWFGGYARGNTNKGAPRNYAEESAKNILRQAPNLKGCEFYNVSYDQLIIPQNSIIYCDPPYADTTGYKTGDFDHAKFWHWCEQMVRDGHIVFVSEYSAPDNWKCVWSKSVNNTLAKDTGSKQGVEKLFTLLKSDL